LTRAGCLRHNKKYGIISGNINRRNHMKAFAADPQITIGQPSNIKIGDLGQLISALVGVLLIISALLAFFFLILGGISWITSGGDKAKMEEARNKITHAIVGLIIVGAAWAVMTLVQNFLGVTIIGGTLDFPKPY
jgi:hypothetical protein